MRKGNGGRYGGDRAEFFYKQLASLQRQQAALEMKLKEAARPDGPSRGPSLALTEATAAQADNVVVKEKLVMEATAAPAEVDAEEPNPASKWKMSKEKLVCDRHCRGCRLPRRRGSAAGSARSARTGATAETCAVGSLAVDGGIAVPACRGKASETKAGGSPSSGCGRCCSRC